MRRQAIILLTVTGLIVGMICALRGRAWAAADTATLQSVTLATGPAGTELVLLVHGVYSYKTVQAGPSTFFIDLADVRTDGVAKSQQWTDPVFSGYKLLPYQDPSGQPTVRVQVDTKLAGPFVVHKDGEKLRVLNGKGLPAHSAGAPPLSPAPAATSAHATPAAASKELLLVSKVTVDKRESGETDVDVSTSSRSANFRVITLPNPPRLVIDIDSAENTSRQKDFPVGTAVLKTVRIGQFRAGDPSVVRVVAELIGDPAFDVHLIPEGLRIELRPRGAKPEPVTATAAVAPPKPEAARTVKVAAKQTPTAPVPVSASQVVVAPASPVKVVDQKTAVTPPHQAETRETVKADVQNTLPAVTDSKPAVAAPLPPPAESTPEALRAKLAAQTLTIDRNVRPPAAQATPPAGAINPPAEPKPVYTGEPISLNLKDVDLKDFFRLIHEISGLNIIIDPNVSGTVTVVLDSVPWDQALDIVLKNNRLGKVLEGNVLRIARVETLTAEQEGQAKLAEARISSAPLVTVFMPLSYAKAQEISALLKGWTGGGGLSRRGTVLVDIRSNTLIISDVQSQIPILENVVHKLDRKAKQISIEARVVLATADFTRTLSTALSGAGANSSGSTAYGMATGSSASITPNTTVPTESPGPGSFTIPQTASTGFGAIAITNASSRYLINAVITAQEERDQAKTISRPTIVTQNNLQGMVQQGTQVPIQTSINNTISVQYYPATLQLTVTPQVTQDGNIFMQINVENNSVGATVTGVGPEIATQQATTSVLVPDGGTVIFGGITVTSRTKSATYVPILGNIPLLGNLFKTSNVQDQDQELLFFVSPKVIGG